MANSREKRVKQQENMSKFDGRRLGEIRGRPRDLLDEIKGCAHYDKEMVSARNRHRNIMVDILDHFHYAKMSRATQLERKNGDIGHWAVCLNREICGVDEWSHRYSDDEEQFQALNCEVCGNYQNSPTFGGLVDMSDVYEEAERFLIRFSRMLEVMPTRLRCHCEEE